MFGSKSKENHTSTVDQGNKRGHTMEQNQGFTGRITRFAARHPWRTLSAWLVLVVIAFAASGAMKASSDTATAGTEATTAKNLIEERLREQTPPEEFIIVESATITAEEAAFAGFIDSLVADLEALAEVDSVASYRNGGEGLVSDDGHTALVTARLTGDEEEAADTAKPLVAVIEAADGTDGFRVTTVGFGSVEGEITSLLEDTLKQGELIGIAVALVVLIIVFGAVVAAGVPIVVALLSIFVAIGATALVSNAIEMSEFVVFIITMIGLAVGIDYSLFIVQRYREERARGLQKIEAITMAGATASRTVFFSGMAVAIALAGMLIVPDPVFRSFAVGAILVVAVTVLAALTLLPAVLSLLGDRINWLSLPFIGKRGELKGSGGLWGLTTRAVTAQPVLSVVVSGGMLIALALPVFNINLGTVGISTLPDDSESRHAFDVLNQQFSDGVLTADIAIDSPNVNTPEVQGSMDQLIASLNGDEFFGASTIEKNESGDLALVTVAMPGDFSSPESKSALERLRGEYIPAAFDGDTAEVVVGGPTAENVDSVQVQKDYLPFVFAFVLGLSFLLLLVAFRSIVVPLKAVIMNLLSVGAAYGILVLVFQEGVGTKLLGFQESPVIESWLPLFLFAILFGLSMDYHVFLLSRIKERYDETGDNRSAVAYGLRQTASIITGAALIMVAVFAGMASGDLVIFQQVGFGLAVAILIDATIIRMVLVPASMELLGDWNWYFPRWLAWVPDVQVDREPERVARFVPATADQAIGGRE
jgi:putative drug exporter of the RND superfamily